MPRHVSPTDPQRGATAPYNFVPLPECVFTVADGIEVDGKKISPWKMHDRFEPGTHSGWIELAIKTLTPLYIRGAVTRSADDAWDDRDSRLRPEPYQTSDGRPAIPGSSLRGMVRALVEILSFAKIEPVSDARPFFRDISPSRISTEYRRHFIEELGILSSGVDIANGRPISRTAPGYRARVRAGFVDARRRIISECGLARVEQALIQQQLQKKPLVGSGPMATPDWAIQHLEVCVQVNPKPGDYFLARQTSPRGNQRHPDLYLRFRKVHALSRSAAQGHHRGILVITGGVPHKHLEFVFLQEERVGEIRIPDAIWDRFHDEDQITQWQERAFPRNQPQGATRPAAGHLRDGEPVFFLVDEAKKSNDNPDGLVFLGRAGMFRFPYDLSPRELVPETLRHEPLDLAEAMFGKVDKDETIKGRAFFEDAVATGKRADWLEEVIVLRILSAPKPTTFQHYLTQDGTKGRDQLTTYLEGDQTTIRGHKLYWHRWEQGLSQVKVTDKHDELLKELQSREPKDTQHTVIRPVKADVTFEGRIRFENLTDLELGALLCALQLPEGCAHKLGMGKPLGLGTVQIAARLRLVDRAARYRSWPASGLDENETGARFRDAFVGAMLAHARESQEAMLPGRKYLGQIARLDALYRLLSWTDRPHPDSTEYMELPRFRDRPVLPTPHGVSGASEPPWPPDPPQAGDSGHGGSPGRDERRARPDGTGGQHLARSAHATPPRAETPKTPPTKPVQKGQTRTGTLRRGGEVWVAVFEGDPREARITNPDKVPANCSDGAMAEFHITEQSKYAGIKCRLERMLEGPNVAP